MPQASDELRAKMVEYFGPGGCDSFHAANFLRALGWTEESWVWSAPAVRSISQKEWDCIYFLRDEWDHSFHPVGYKKGFKVGKAQPVKKEEVDHPAHYGGVDDPYEAIKVIEAWKLGFNLGSLLKYIRRAGSKPPDAVETMKEMEIKDLKKARWYLDREIQNKEKELGNGKQ